MADKMAEQLAELMVVPRVERMAVHLVGLLVDYLVAWLVD
jgi:hypothetical protein